MIDGEEEEAIQARLACPNCEGEEFTSDEMPETWKDLRLRCFNCGELVNVGDILLQVEELRAANAWRPKSLLS